MSGDDLGKHVAEISGYREISSFEATLVGESGPIPVNAAVDAAANYQHRVAVTVVGAAVAVLRDGPSEFRHRDNHRVGQAITEVRCQRGQST